MTSTEVLKEVNRVFCEVFDDEGIIISEATKPDDIDEWDSLMHITLISEIEDVFNIHFEMDDVTKMKNVGDICCIIMEKINGV